eukprot:CAMPEP_0174725948 /NCGR_PEP_ID=MMETSP1094-20130205/46741_1 /TAXON_ID=156173 /ORGANISM="Chrysochromulina brevifilum, Strain UTEX LB 985" /LENGTH=100 /DNA_ID=CAMNT_0015927441 /DNA_START=410 /DNA_END=713 /DNA_ORIENTATION=+
MANRVRRGECPIGTPLLPIGVNEARDGVLEARARSISALDSIALRRRALWVIASLRHRVNEAGRLRGEIAVTPTLLLVCREAHVATQRAPATHQSTTADH